MLTTVLLAALASVGCAQVQVTRGTAFGNLPRRHWNVAKNDRFVIGHAKEVVRTGANSGTRTDIVASMNTFLAADVLYAYSKAEAMGTVDMDNNETGQVSVQRSAVGVYVAFGYLFEYDDNNGVDGFQVNTTDAITGYFDLRHWSNQWSPIACGTTAVGTGAAAYNVSSCNTTTNNDVFMLRVTVADDFSVVEDHVISPNDMKIDVTIKWFNNPQYTQMTPLARLACVAAPNICRATGPSDPTEHPNAKVGLAALILSKSKVQNFVASRTVSAGKAEGAWSLTAADGETIEFNFDSTTSEGTPVLTQQMADVPSAYPNANNINQWVAQQKSRKGITDSRFLIFSFNSAAGRPETLTWDPELAARESSASTLMVSAAAVVVAMLAALW